MNSNYEGWPTTRRYPHTLKDAFPNDIENAQWWYPPERRVGILEIALWAAGVCMWVGLAYYFANL